MAMLPYITDRTKVIWLCNPNNPTGGIYTEEEQTAFLDKVPEDILVVIDEAYYEYAVACDKYPDSIKQLANRKNNRKLGNVSSKRDLLPIYSPHFSITVTSGIMLEANTV
jgi:histidinol-phosphate/aromatic aminotransferase/cobyric acid decarboxylase-like protein